MDLRKKKNRYETNPFVLELKGKMYLQPKANAIIAKGQSIVDTSTGEVINESILIGRRKIVDKSQFAKIYASEIAMLYDLSKTAQNVFLYLTKVMDYENKAYINAELDCKKLGYKTPLSITKGLKELFKNDIIAPAIMQGYYWLNPKIVCKGERFAMYTEFVVGKDGETIKAENELKQQTKTIIEQLPEQVEYKLDKANQTDIFIDYPNNSPYEGEEK